MNIGHDSIRSVVGCLWVCILFLRRDMFFPALSVEEHFGTSSDSFFWFYFLSWQALSVGGFSKIGIKVDVWIWMGGRFFSFLLVFFLYWDLFGVRQPGPALYPRHKHKLCFASFLIFQLLVFLHLSCVIDCGSTDDGPVRQHNIDLSKIS